MQIILQGQPSGITTAQIVRSHDGVGEADFPVKLFQSDREE